MAKAKKATKAKGNKATVAKAADFKTAIVKEPKAVLQAIGMDFSVAYDKSNNKATMGDVLAAGSKKQREDFAVELEQALVKANEIWTGFESKVDTFIPGQFKRIPADEKIWPVRPVIPGPDPIIPRNPIIPIDPIIPIIINPIIPVDPIIPIVNPIIIPDPKSPVVDQLDVKEIVGRAELLPQLEERLVQIQGIRKSLPANATKAEKKAAATAEQQVKNLIKAAKRSAPKAVKQAVKQAVKKAVKTVAKKAVAKKK